MAGGDVNRVMVKRVMRNLLVLVAVLVLAVCNKAAVPPPPPAQPPAIVVKERPGLLFTYVDAAGVQQQTETLSAIPDDRRDNVRVIDLSLPPEQRGAGQWVYVADLRKANADGSFPYQVQSHVRFEQASATQAVREKVQEAMAQSKNRVTVYTTAWCGVCAKAKAYLRDHGVAFVERDVEQDASAQVELQAKAKRAGVQPQGVPVIDVYGELLLGFDETRLSRLLGRGQTL